ncbi:TRAP transporter substrate-binding protein [Brooklawnia sp.]|uniref:TRAP transporter substrate-binding protein n=1 Tax=Brooklawnia sp. TaxID=2699740 RepID=UPI00311F4257
MKKRLLTATALLASLALAGCGLGPATVDDEGGEGRVIKIAGTWNQTHPVAASLDNVLKPEIEEKTNGALTLDVYHSGTLGNEADLWDAVRNGTIEMAVVGTPMNQEFPTMLISDWPWLYRDVEHAKATWTGDVADDLSAQFHEKFPETQILSWGPNSARTFSSSKQLTSPADFAGQKFRMPNNPIHLGLAADLGASAQVIPLGELFSALETGVVDGQDNGMVTIVSEGLYEVQQYVYETNHIVATMEIVANQAFLDSLTEEQLKIVQDAAKKATEQAWDNYIASIAKDRQTLIDNGLTVTPLTDADRAVLVEKTKPTVDKLYADNDWAKELVTKIENVK